MTLKYFQKGFNFSQDGPGNRLVYHLQGCNLTCPWCANPEGLNAQAECIEEEVDSIVEECRSCSLMFFEGGGVTLTGGEPTMQFEAVKELLTKLRASSINTALECNATHPRLPELFNLVDFLILDCKHYDCDIHKKVCGSGNEQIIKNISLASHSRDQLLIRIPLINGFNASEHDANEFVKLFMGICTDICCYEFLCYHEFGKDKYAKCSLDYTVTNGFVSNEAFNKFKQIFSDNNLTIIYT